MINSRNKALVKNTGLYFIGNFASKVLNIILVPIYMVYLEADSYGIVDMMLLLSSILALLFSLNMTDAIYRYLLDANDEDTIGHIITNGIFVYLIGSITFVIVFIIGNRFFDIPYRVPFLLHILVANFGQMLLQLCRGIKKNASYAIGGMLLTFIQGISNIILIVVFHMDASSLLIAAIISNGICGLYLTIVTKWHRYVDLKKCDINYVKKMVSYSFPLFIQVLLLWIIQNSGTYFLTYYSKSAIDSGIYGISNKFPNILNALCSIFLLAWQESAIVEKNDKDAKAFYRNIYNKYISLLLASVAVLLPVVKIYLNYFNDSTYSDVWLYVPILMGSSLINGITNFVGMHFIVTQKTMILVKSFIPSTIVILVSNLVLVERYKIFAVTISQLVAFTISLIIRKKNLTDIYRLDFHNFKIMGSITCFVVSLVVYYLFNKMFQFIAVFVIISFFLSLWRNEIRIAVKHAYRKVKR